MKNKLSIFVCTWLLFALSACGQSTQKENSNTIENLKKYYVQDKKNIEYAQMYFCNTLCSSCTYDIFIDDVFVLSTRASGLDQGLSLSIPINSLIFHNGTHEFKAKMYPLEGKTTLGGIVDNRDGRPPFYSAGQLFIHIDHHDKINPKAELHTVKEFDCYDYTDDEVNERISKLSYYEFSGTYEITQLPVECIGWSKSINLEKICENTNMKEQLKKELYNQYIAIHKVLENNDIDGFMQLTSEREKLLDTMLCYSEFDINTRIETIDKLVNGKDGKLQPLVPINSVHLSFMAYGKLVTLLDKNDNGIIQYVDDDEGVTTADLRFHRKTADAKLEVIY